jgi:hypothetical protein
MFYASQIGKRKLFHLSYCKYAKRIAPGNRVRFDSFSAAYRAGFRLCPHCSTIRNDPWVQNGSLDRKCKKHRFLFDWEGGALCITTHTDQWMLIPGDVMHRLYLLHKNQRPDERKSVIPGYHLQRVYLDKLNDYLDYMVEHQEFRQKTRPPKGSRRWRKQQAAQKRAARALSIRNTLDLCDRLSAQSG